MFNILSYRIKRRVALISVKVARRNYDREEVDYWRLVLGSLRLRARRVGLV
jgi:hypothetical protein